MKKIEPTISPFLLEPVKEALKEIGLSGITVSEVQDFLPSTDPEIPSAFTPRLMLEVVVGDVVCEEAVAAIQEEGRINESCLKKAKASSEELALRPGAEATGSTVYTG